MIMLVWFLTTASVAATQTLTVLHSFRDGNDGAEPGAGMTMDRGGNLYGSTQYGGDQSCFGGGEGNPNGCGVLFQMKKTKSGWLFNTIYVFPGSLWGYVFVASGGLAIGPNGSLYGITNGGGDYDDGTVFNLLPSPAAPRTALVSWNYNTVNQFTGNDGAAPTRLDPLQFDPAGNIYGAATYGGPANDGVVYEMTPSEGGWTENVLYSFTGGSDGYHIRGVSLDENGNIYGVAAYGGGNQDCGFDYGCGTIYELTHSQSGWTETTLHTFQQGLEGGWPGPLIRDKAGNLYGMTYGYGPDNSGGTVWELSPSSGGWAFGVIHAFPTHTVEDYGPYPLAMDAAGNLYGISGLGGQENEGFVFKLTPSNGGWTYTELYDFVGHLDGCWPQGAPLLDGEGNIYGLTRFCGQYGWGTIWELTP